MDVQSNSLLFLPLGYTILPRHQNININGREIEKRGLDRTYASKFDSVLPWDPEILVAFGQDVLLDQNRYGFYKEFNRAVYVCDNLNKILERLADEGELDIFDHYDKEYEVVASKIEESAREELIKDGIDANFHINLELTPHFLGYDVSSAGGDFSAIENGLFGLTHYLDTFLPLLNENGLFSTSYDAERFRRAYLSSPSKETGNFYMHALYSRV